ncbi:MAG: hypothetical protein EOL95_10855 [Bacteroidia bacterium]|nr:hypothetical protein [Bacteroidia bacterium]
MAKQIQQPTPPRYKYFCHNCKEKFYSSELTYRCECGGKALTITDYDKPSSGYFVDGVKR